MINSISFKNDLSSGVSIYLSTDDTNAGQPNYIARLSFVGHIEPSGTLAINQQADLTSVYICYDNQNKPVKRMVYEGGSSQQGFTITQADADVIASNYSFFDFIAANPNDALSVSFAKLTEGGNATPDQIDAFYEDTANYQACTYVSYILVLAALSADTGTSPADTAYSLKSLIGYMGVKWPSLLPDFPVSSFTCTTLNGNGNLVSLSCDVNMEDIYFGSQIAANIFTITPFNSVKVVHVNISFSYTLTPDLVTVALTFSLDAIRIPVATNTDITLSNPAITFSLSPQSGEVGFMAQATIPFKLWSNPTFYADLSMVIGADQANIGVVIRGDNSVLFTPPIIQGVHFTSFGVGMGVFFQPIIGYSLGVQGSFTIGKPEDNVLVEDNSFAVVCALIGDIPNPLYISFYVSQISLNELVTIFTDVDFNIDFPVSVKNLSFVWQENPTQPVVLPDGSTSKYEFGFSGYLDFFGLGFYGDLDINPVSGVNGIITMSPYELGPLSLKGNGQAISIKVNEAGDPISNNVVPETSAEEIAIENAGTEVIIKAGGPVMEVSTFASPYFVASIAIAFLDSRQSVEASVTSSGFSFELDFESVLTTRMACVLKNYQYFSGSFTYGADFMIQIPDSVDVFNLGSIHFVSTISSELTIDTSANVIRFTYVGSFNFAGYHYHIPELSLDINTQSLQDIINMANQWIIDNVTSLFKNLYADAAAWINAITQGVIVLATNTAEYVMEGFKVVYGVSAEAVGDLLKGTTYALNDVAKGMKDVYNATSTLTTQTLVTAYNAAEDSAAAALQYAGYTADEIADALVNVYGSTMEVVGEILLALGYSADVVAQALTEAFNATEAEVAAVMAELGYAIDTAGNWVEKTAKDAADATKNAADDALKQATDSTKDAADSAIKETEDAAKDAADEAEKAAKDAADAAKDAADSALKASEDAAKDAADAAKDAADEAAKAAKDAADAAKNAADSAKNATDSALKSAADAIIP
ncbi:phage tail tape measure protein [Emticicia fluvialis]|uniref:phage tail tape measure protein n=1 Tax=Emticicia fluvialis TaxID=2974474 RepID=UPI002165F51F|nr:phage tail tape measure protein [Emticicia fluvialis]